MGESQETCIICLGDRDGLIARLPCGHEFHEACLMRWLVVKPTCPMCRDLVVVPDNEPE